MAKFYLIILGRPGGVGTTPWRFSLVTFLMIPIAKIASSYLLLGMGDPFDICDIILTLSRDMCHDVKRPRRWSKCTVFTIVC